MGLKKTDDHWAFLVFISLLHTLLGSMSVDSGFLFLLSCWVLFLNLEMGFLGFLELEMSGFSDFGGQVVVDYNISASGFCFVFFVCFCFIALEIMGALNLILWIYSE